MAEMNFDLEDAQNELETVKNLLGVFQEYFIDECPSDGDTMGAIVFASRAPQYGSLVSAAWDKIAAMVDEMETAIKEYFSECKKERG